MVRQILKATVLTTLLLTWAVPAAELLAQTGERASKRTQAKQADRSPTRYGDRRVRIESPNKDSDTLRKPSKRNGWGSAANSLISLGFVLGLLLLGAKILKKHLPHVAATLPAEAIQLLGQRQIGARQVIQLVRCGSRVLVLGSTQHGLTTLAEITDPVEVDYLAGLSHQQKPNSVTNSFAQLFQTHRAVVDENQQSQPTERLKQRLRRAAEDSADHPSPSQSANV